MFMDGFDTVDSHTKWELGTELRAADLNLQCGLHIHIDKIRAAGHIDDIDKAQCTFDSNGELSSITVTKPENGIVMIDNLEKLLEVFGKPDSVVSYDIESMYPHVIRVARVEDVDNKMQQPYIHGLDYITIDFKTVKQGVPFDEHVDNFIFSEWTNVDDQEAECEEAPQELCEDLPLICRSQWDRIKSWEHSLFGVSPNGIQRTRPLDVHSLHTIALQQRLLAGESEVEPEAGLQS